jgi:hypothetical protein
VLYDLKIQIKHYVGIISSLFQKDTWQQLKPCDVLLVRHDNDCGYTFHNKAYAHIIDSFGELCTKRGLTIGSVATPFSKLIGDKAYHSPVSYNQSFSILYIFGKVIQLIRRQNISSEWIGSRKLNLWCKILEKSSPKWVVGIQPDEFLCRAGKIKNIPIYDLQHGVISDENPWYGEIYRNTTSIKNLPDGFLCWDDQSVATILKWAHNKGIKVIKIGNPWFIRFFRIQPEDLLVNEALAEGQGIDDKRPCIIVSLQWGLAIEYPDRIFNGVMVDALEKVILGTEKNYNWILRLHPVQMRSTEREYVLNYLKITFGAKRIELWIKASELPLPVVLQKADLHITDSSTVVIEAAWLGIRNGLLSEQLGFGGKYHSYFSNERNYGIAEVIPQNPEIIKKWIIDTLAKGRGQSTLKESGQNLDNFIDEIAGLKS